MAAYTWVGGTIGSPNAYGTALNWSGGIVPLPSDTITFSGSNSCDLGSVNRTVAGVTFSGYTGTLALTGNLIVNGNVTFQAGAMLVSGTNALIIGGNSTITTNGGSWLGNLQLGNATSITVTLLSGFNVSGTLSFSNTVSLVGTFFITVLGNLVAQSNCIVSTVNATQTTIVLAGASSQWSGDGRIGCNLTFNGISSAFVISGSVVFGSVVVGSASPQLNFTSGASTTTTGSTLTLVGSVQMSAQGIVFGNVNFGTLGLNQLFTISLIQDLIIGGNLVVGLGGAGQHQISRSATQKIFVRGDFQVGFNNVNNSINGQGANGGEIVMQGNASTTSVMSSFFNGGAGSAKCWCNVDVTIDAGANTIQLSTTNEFNFGNPVASALSPRRFKYTSGTFTTTGSTINLANSIIDLDNAQLINFNNVRIYAFGSGAIVTNVQLQKDTTITGNLITGGFSSGASTSTLTLPTAGTATALTIQGGILLSSTSFVTRQQNPLISTTISLNFVGSGTIEGNSMCNANINLNAGTYTINDFHFGNSSLSPLTTPIFKYNAGTINCTGTLYTSNAKLDLASVQLNNLAPMSATGPGNGGTFTLTILASTILRVNGNYTTGIELPANPSNQYGSTTLNRDVSTPSAQLDVYGSVNMSSLGVPLTGTSGTCPIYMKGTGNLTTNNQPFCGVDIFINGVTITLLNFWIGNNKRLEYISGGLVTANSITTISNFQTATIKTLGQTWGDVGVRGGANAIFDGNINCRDLITYNDGSSATYLAGAAAGVVVTIRRNLTLGNTSPLFSINNQPVGAFAISKLVMTAAASDGSIGVWTGNSQRLDISLDLNAPLRTIQVTGTVLFGSNTTHTLTYFPTTIMNTTGSLLGTGGASLDLGNELWGGLSAGFNVTINLISDAKFTNVSLGGAGGTGLILNGIAATKNLTITGNFTNNQTNGGIFTNTTFQPVKIIFDGNGTWSGAGATQLNVDLLSGTRTLSGTVVWGGGLVGGNKTLQSTGGSIAGGASTFIITSSSTISIDKTTRGSFFNVVTASGITLTLNAQMGVSGTLTLNNTAANTTTFASSSTFGWDAVNFTHGGGDTTCILNAGSNYNVSGTFTMLGSNNTTRATLRSSKLSTFTAATANGTTLTSGGVGGNAVEIGMELSQASVVASGGFAAIYPNRPILTSASGSPFTLDALYPVTPSTGPVNMEAGVKANFNLAAGTGVALVLYVTTKDINSIGGQTIYAFQSYLDAPSNPQANMFRTINWNNLAPPISPIGLGFLSVT